MKTIIFLIFVILLSGNISCNFGQEIGPNINSSNSINKTINVGGLDRNFHVFAPTNLSKSEKAPLVFVFHGGGGNGIGIEKLTKFSILAEKEKFIVVYPDGIGNNWNDGRTLQVLQAQRENVDEIG